MKTPKSKKDIYFINTQTGEKSLLAQNVYVFTKKHKKRILMYYISVSSYEHLKSQNKLPDINDDSFFDTPCFIELVNVPCLIENK